jgi:hypothetical protein
MKASRIIFFIGTHAAIWTIYALLTHKGGLHPDMTEAYAWGREFQLGYPKHPPLWAWTAGAWFSVMSRTHTAFFLLATLNSGAAVAGAWMLAGLFTHDDRYRMAAAASLLLIPFYTVQAHQFNANFALLALWPWAVYFFVLSMENCRRRDAVMFGVLAAAGMLSKYYTAALLASCVAASFAHPNWRRYYRSAAPYITVAVFALLMAPHVWWLFQNDFLPLRYLESKTEFSDAKINWSILSFTLAPLVVCLLPAVVIGIISNARK